MIDAVVIARTMRDGERWAEVEGLAPGDFVVITPESSDRCRGLTVERVIETASAQSLPTDTLARLRSSAVPCTLGWKPEGWH